MRIILIIAIGIVVYLYIKNHSGSSGSKSFSVPSKADLDRMEASLEHSKQVAIEAARKRYEDRLHGLFPYIDETDVLMFSHMERFLNAVKLTSESGGMGNIMLTLNDDHSSFNIHAHYCNYSCMSCMDKLLYDGALDYPGMTMVQGGDEDSFDYDVKNVKIDGYSFSTLWLLRRIIEKLPEAVTTTNAEREDFISVSFRT